MNKKEQQAVTAYQAFPHGPGTILRAPNTRELRKISRINTGAANYTDVALQDGVIATSDHGGYMALCKLKDCKQIAHHTTLEAQYHSAKIAGQHANTLRLMSDELFDKSKRAASLAVVKGFRALKAGTLKFNEEEWLQETLVLDPSVQYQSSIGTPVKLVDVMIGAADKLRFRIDYDHSTQDFDQVPYYTIVKKLEATPCD